jgi:YVTN family beta-propeller protein
VPVGRGPDAVATTPDGRFAYITNFLSSTVSVIRTTDNTVVATVNVPVNPVGVGVTPNGASVYVMMLGATISTIRTSDNTIAATIPVTFNPTRVAFTPDGAFAYITDYVQSSVTVLRTSDNAIVATISNANNPGAIAITPNGQYAYTSHGFHTGASSDPDPVNVIRLSDNTIVSTVPLVGTSFGVAITPNGANVYVLHGRQLAVLRTSDNSLVADFLLGAFGDIPQDVDLTPDGAYAYVPIIPAADPEGPGSVSVVRISDNAVVKSVAVGVRPGGMAIADVPTPSEQLVEVSDVLAGLQLAGGTGTSLQKKLDRAQTLLAAGDAAGACAALQDFINELSALADKKVPAADATQLISTVTAIRKQIGC